MQNRFSGPGLRGGIFCVLSLLLFAASIVQAADPAAVSKLIDALRNPDEKARIQTIDALANLGPAAKAAVKSLAAQLGDKSATVRAHAAHALQLIGPSDPVAVEALLKAVTDSDPVVRRTVVRALHQVQPPTKAVIDALGKELDDTDSAARIEALSALTDLNEAAVPTLITALGDEKGRYWAALALGEIGEKAKDAAEALGASLKDPRPEVRREVLTALARIGEHAAPAVPAIVAHLTDKDPSVRHAAAFALGRIGPPAASAADALRKARDSKDHLMETVSVWALAHIEPNNEAVRKEAITLLTQVISDSKSRAQAAALRGLLELEPDAPKVVPVLAGLMAKGDLESVHEALSAAASFGEAGLPALVAGLERHEARGRAAVLIGRLGSKAASAVGPLTLALADKDSEVRREVLLALSSIGPDAEPAKGEILKALDDPEPRVAAVAAYALGSIGPGAASASPQLRKSLESSDPVVRVASAWALVHVSTKPEQVAALTIPVLVQGLKNENAPIRRGAAEALGRLGKVARPAAEAQLRIAARDTDESVKHAALAALEKMGAVVDAPLSVPVNRQ